MTPNAGLSQQIADILTLLHPYSKGAGALDAASTPLPQLVAECQALSAQNDQNARTIFGIHHFACSGGTLICRALACQANMFILSEVDPFSTLKSKPGSFEPTGIISLGDIGIRRLSDTIAGGIFLEGLYVLQRGLRREGSHLLVRDHSHSHFCTEVDYRDRPLMGDFLRDRFVLRNFVTVRHPLDSFLALLERGWVRFKPATLEKYAQRYLAFLDCYTEAPIFRYEDFVLAPDIVLQQMLEYLGHAYYPDWQELLPEVILTGGSGRKTNTISARERRPISGELTEQERQSPSYEILCRRLGYPPAFSASPFPG